MGFKKIMLFFLYIMFPVAILGKYQGCPAASPEVKKVAEAIYKQKKEIKEEQEKVKNLLDEVIRRLSIKNCAELYNVREKNSGVYTIDPDNGGAFDVYCDQTTAGGGWTVFQKRLDGSVDFYRGWDDYKRGFGNLNGEYWLGLDKIHRLTKQQSKLRVDLEDFNNQTAYAEYDLFVVADEANKYKLSLGTYSGTAGDSLSWHHGMAFSTRDQNNAIWSHGNCATEYKGAWWYRTCHISNLNGLYYHGSHSSFADGVNWEAWRGYYYSVKRAEMKIKPS